MCGCHINCWCEKRKVICMKKILFTLFVALFMITSVVASMTVDYGAIDDYITDASYTSASIGGGLNNGYEPSGVVWHTVLEQVVLVGDDGDVTIMDEDGSNLNTVSPGGDLEGVTVVDPDTDYIYVLDESSSKIREYSLTNKAYTGLSWYLSELDGNANLGPEALTWIPAGVIGSDGLFAVGLQANGAVYFYDVDFSTSGTATLVGSKMKPTKDGTAVGYDISGLHYDEESGILFAVFDAYDLLVSMYYDGSSWVEITYMAVPGKNQEGIAGYYDDDYTGTVFIAQDSGEFLRYDIEVEVETDTDGDGVSDADEATLGTSATDTDSDDDGLTDGEEVNTYGTDPTLKDTDGDTLSDWKEINKHGTDPLDEDDRGPEMVTSFSYSGSELTVTLASARTYTVEPFSAETETDITYAWINKWNRAVFVTNGKLTKVYRNAELSREQKSGVWKITDYQVDGSDVTITYKNGHEVTLDPFSGDDIEYSWMNSKERLLYVVNADYDGYVYKNGQLKKSFSVNPARFA
jgi:hypothetical protein